MSSSVARIGAALRISPRMAWLAALLLLVCLAAIVALATRRGMLPIGFTLVLVAFVTAVSFRWPLLGLAVFAALIPLEEALRIEGIGTLSRLAGILFAATYGLPRLGRLRFGAMPTAGWAYLAWALLSLGWAIDPETAWGQLLTLLQLVLIAVLAADYVVQQPAIVRQVLWVYSISAAATALFGIQAYALTDTRAAAIQDQNPAQFAAVLLPALAFALYELLNGNRRVLAGAIALVTTLGVLVSGTRGAWVAVAIMALVFVLPRLSRRRQIAAIAFAAVTIVVALQLPGVGSLVIERTASALTSGGAGRTDIWSVGATIYRSAPVLGVGYANFPVAYTPDVVRATDIEFNTGFGRGPHNLVLGTLVELGPIGLLILTLFVVPLVLQRGWGPDAATVQAALASLFTLALFLDIFANRKQVWLFIGIAAGLAMLSRTTRSEHAPATTLARSLAQTWRSAPRVRRPDRPTTRVDGE